MKKLSLMEHSIKYLFVTLAFFYIGMFVFDLDQKLVMFSCLDNMAALVGFYLIASYFLLCVTFDKAEINYIDLALDCFSIHFLGIGAYLLVSPLIPGKLLGLLGMVAAFAAKNITFMQNKKHVAVSVIVSGILIVVLLFSFFAFDAFLQKNHDELGEFAAEKLLYTGDNLTYGKKVRCFHYIVADLSHELGMPDKIPRIAITDQLSKSAAACYARENNTIYYSQTSMNRLVGDAIIRLAAHEVFHAAQYEFIEGNADNEYTNSLDKDTLAYEFEHYITSDYAAYDDQLVEKSANEYAWNRYCQYCFKDEKEDDEE